MTQTLAADTLTLRRIHLPVVEPDGDGNIRRRYAIEDAAWLWHPDLAVDASAFLRFTNRFTLDAPTTIRLHVSADQRYELHLDGAYVGMGPDRGDLLHWSFASYEIELAAGDHELDALVWWLDAGQPTAQVSWRGAFLCAGEGAEPLINTGLGAWRVQQLAGWSLEHKHMEAYHAIGDQLVIDGRAWHEPASPAVTPAVILPPLASNNTGVARPGWQLHPSPLPDMIRRVIQPGRIRAVHDAGRDHVEAGDCDNDACAPWQRVLAGEAIEIPAHTAAHVVWDLEDYYCGYAHAVLSGGADSELAFEWAESLYERDAAGERVKDKNDRNAVAGKTWFGFGDRFRHDGGEQRRYQGHWWRSGRYVRLSLRTADAPLRIERVAIVATRYPWDNDAHFTSDDADLEPIIKLGVRGLQTCMHETYMDCPYYEQMMYVGDTRLQMLVNYACSRDRALARRGIELFDWSRWRTGLIAERYPSEPFQLSPTFAMIWVAMVRDYAWWSDDAPFVRERMVGVRCLIENLLPLLDERSLLRRLPGWPFVDWVPEWDTGYAPDGGTGVTSINNLLFVLALQSAAALERAYGEQTLADRCEDLASRIAASVFEHFWHDGEGCLADDPARTHFSEHAQCLGLITRTLAGDVADRAVARMLDGRNMARTTVYFSFYLLETLYQLGRGDLIVKHLDLWKQMVRTGLCTPLEQPEPTRSDCHAWGAHPIYHMHASLAGIRPAAAGFARVSIAPSPGPLRHLESTVPHPGGGEIKLLMDIDEAQRCQATVTLPAGVPGVFAWAGQRVELPGGERTEVALPG